MPAQLGRAALGPLESGGRRVAVKLDPYTSAADVLDDRVRALVDPGVLLEVDVRRRPLLPQALLVYGVA